MQKIENLSEEQIKYAIDLSVTLVVDELLQVCDMSPEELISDFISSKTGMLLYDESSKLWCAGPAYIANLYLEEKNNKK